VRANDAKHQRKCLNVQLSGGVSPRLLGAIGSASDSRSEGWEFDSLRGHSFFRILFIRLIQLISTIFLIKPTIKLKDSVES
jgi:hypothetical protein